MGIQQVASYAAEGYPIFKIASLTGYSEDSLKKILEEPKMQERVAELKTRPKEAVVDDQYDRLEKTALDRLEETMAFAEPDICLKIIDRVQKKKESTRAPANGANGLNIQFVNLQLPGHLLPTTDNQLTLNADGEIVAVGGRSFAAMPLDGVKSLFHKIAAERQVAAEITAGQQIAAEEI